MGSVNTRTAIAVEEASVETKPSGIKSLKRPRKKKVVENITERSRNEAVAKKNVSGNETMIEEEQFDKAFKALSSRSPHEKEQILGWLFNRIAEEVDKTLEEINKYPVPTLPKPGSYQLYPGKRKKPDYLGWLDKYWGKFLKKREINGQTYFRGEIDVLTQRDLRERDEKLFNTCRWNLKDDYGLDASDVIPSSQDQPRKNISGNYTSLNTARWIIRRSVAIRNHIQNILSPA